MCTRYSCHMQRDTLRPLHTFPILIRTDGSDYDGLVGLNPVRIVKDAQLDSIKKIRKLVGEKDCAAIVGALYGIQAHNVRDSKRMQQAYELLVQGLVVSVEEQNDPLAPVRLVPRPDAEKLLANSFPPTKGQYFLPKLINPRLGEARVVLWWQKKPNQLSAGLLCPDYTSAIFATLLLGKMGFRKCLQCGKIFRVSAKYPKQNYCTPAHREARRVARWREKQQEEKRP